MLQKLPTLNCLYLNGNKIDSNIIDKLQSIRTTINIL